MTVIDETDLVSYPGLDIADDDDPTKLLDLVNGLIGEKWTRPADPVPIGVKLIALSVFTRAWTNPHGLSSTTRSVDDASRTERLPDQYARAGVYLTGPELAELRRDAGSRRRRYGNLRTRAGY